MTKAMHVYSVRLQDDQEAVHGPFGVEHRSSMLSNKQVEEAARLVAAARHGNDAKQWTLYDFSCQQAN